MEMLLMMMIVLTLGLFIKLGFENSEVYYQWDLSSDYSLSLDWVILLDFYSLLFILVVLLISLMVMIYSNEYMSGDGHINRFKMMVLWFVGSMLLLVMSPNLVSMILGWDGLGLSSYCLVIYYSNSNSNAAGMITVLTNRIGDVILLCMIGIMSVYGQFDYMFLFFDSLLGLMSILVAITKSAQIPFSAWLPAAMAAPTPVSSLVHSSTLVTAGIYFLFRFGDKTLIYGDLLLFLGSLTMLVSGVCGCFELDFKKVIALSTLSQLGMMTFGLGLGIYNWVFLHLLVHALFKSMMFMSAGVVIHSMKSSQDFRCMGGLLINFPFVGSLFLLSVFSLCGFPFMGGFYSKDLLVEVFFSGSMGFISVLMFIVGLFFTLAYSLRFSFSLMSGTFNGFSLSNFNYGFSFFYSLLILFIFSLTSGYALLSMINKLDLMSIPSFEEKFLAFTLFMLMAYLFVFSNGLSVSKFFVNYFSTMIGLPKISSFISYYSLKMSMNMVSIVDLGWLEKSGPLGLSSEMKSWSKMMMFFSMGSLSSYFLLYFFLILLMVMVM
uniref:NADH-ubiquinone oxidoreductase chain 5 n=1 Tax=Argulus japonicus TaxID=873553 RepID=A0A7I8F071_9CRUS|nr:NADH dehydrogenase subunit 5 [Argulus japonicus]